MKNKIRLDLDKDDIIILSMALRSLNTLRLSPRLTYVVPGVSGDVVQCMNSTMNGFIRMTCEMDLVVDNTSERIASLFSQIDYADGDDAYQSFVMRLKYSSGNED